MAKSKARYKNCPACKEGVCKTCKGAGKVRIVKGRAKGARFENDIARQVTLWTGMKFTRSPSSGGWAKTGDITPKNPEHMVQFPFNMELKNNEILEFSNIFHAHKNKKMPIRKWWKQAFQDAKKSGKIPVLVFTKSREEVFCMVQQDIFFRLGLDKTAVQVHMGKHNVVLWQDLLNIPYKDVLKALKNGR